MDEQLSLATFEDNRAYAPYLTTPRSLEACRMSGVNPVELVEVPIAEFQKDFPNDPDAAQRRFERIDGARKRILTKVKQDWSKLVEKNWKPSKTRSAAAMKRERILEVPEESHCALLETQAQQFRKIEMENFNSLNRMLKLEVKKAIAEQMNKQILQKHENIEKQNNDTKGQIQAIKDAAIQAEIERTKKKEADFKAETKAQQAYDAINAKRAAEDLVSKTKREKELREKREIDRLAREEYTREMKLSIMGTIESKAEANRKMLEMKNQLLEERRRDEKEIHDNRNAERRKQENEKSQRAKSDALMLGEQERAAVVQKIIEAEEHRNKIIAARQAKRVEEQEESGNYSKEKLQRIREKTKSDTEDRAMKVKKEYDCKEEIARQELEKVKDGIEKRRGIKAIKQEAFEISAMRTKKVKEYKMDKLNRDIQNKDMRCNAVKKGFQVLGQMRNSMKDILNVTNSLLKEEIALLKHKDNFTAEEVVEKALRISETIMFPRLQSTFGSKPLVDTLTSDELFSIDFKDGDFADKAEAFLQAQDEGATGNVAEPEKKITTKKIDPSITRLDRPNAPMPRTNFATLPVATITHDRFSEVLMASKDKLMQKALAESPEKSSPKKTRTVTPAVTTRNTTTLLPELASSHSHLSPHPGGSYDTQDDLKLLRSTAILDIGDGEGSNPHKHSKRSTGGHGHAKTKSHGGHYYSGHSSSHSVGSHDTDGTDPVDLPIFPFSPMESTTEKEPEVVVKETKPAAKPVFKGTKKKEIRTDVNEKAKYLEPPAGKFRREFSTDHPLAAGGTGKYDKEAKKGIAPTGLPDGVVQTYGNVKTALDNAAKVEKLTYLAQNSTVDPTKELEKLRTKQNAVLKQILDEERSAEEERERLKKTVTGPEDMARLDSIFTEERRRANQRIIAATKEHEQTIKEAVLRQMNLMKPAKRIDQIGRDDY